MVEGSQAGDLNLQALVERATAAPGRVGCWAARLDGNAEEYMRLIGEAMPNINLSEVVRTLNRDLGVTVGRSAVTRHLHGECHC